MTLLRGITWDHARGSGGLDATARAYNESHEATQVKWERIPLPELKGRNLEDLAGFYDLIMIDHTEVGSAERNGSLLPFDAVVPREVLELLHEQSAGPSHRSYEYAGHQWALAADASSLVSAYRPDLLGSPPGDWESVTDLALRRGTSVAIPLLPADSFASFLTLCANGGEPPFSHEDKVAPRETALRALTLLGRLAGLVNRASLTLDATGVLEMMSTGDEIAYSPLLDGHSNYSRSGFRRSAVRFADIPSSGEGPTGSLLGGRGIAISSRCPDPKVAAEYSVWVCQPEVQRGLYFDSGGQPGNRAAWLDEGVNRASDDFFRRTLATLSGAYLGPRYDGYLEVEAACGALIHNWLVNGGDAEKLYGELNARYAGTRRDSKA